MNTEKSQNPLSVTPISKLIVKYAIPSIISMLVASAYNITDQIFIGNVVGMLGNAATNVTFPVVMLCGAFAQLIGIGTATNFNIQMGKGKENESALFLGTGLTVLSIMGVFLMSIVLIFKTPLLLFCGATDTVLPYANTYLWITALGIPFFTFTQAAGTLIRADGSPTYSMFSSIIGAILNVFLDWLFMFIFKWGLAGAAAATVTGQVVSFVICILYFRKFKSFKIKMSMFGIKLTYISQIIKLGMSNFINFIIMATVNIVMNNSLKYYGSLSVYGSDIPLAVSGVIAKLSTIMTSVTVGLAQGCQPIFGFNMGAKNYTRVKETYKKALVGVFAVSISGFLAFQLFPRQIVSIFGGTSELYLQFAERYLRIFLMMICVSGIQPLSVNYFTSTGNARQGIILSISRQGFLLLPLLVILPMIFGIDGVLCAGPIADGLAFLLSISLVTFDFRRLTEMQKSAQL